MKGRLITLSISLVSFMVDTHAAQRREPSLFLAYEREVAKSDENTLHNENPFAKVLIPLHSSKVNQTPMLNAVIPPALEGVHTSEKSDNPNDAQPYLVINKAVEALPLICPETANNSTEQKVKKSLFQNLRSMKERVLSRAKELLGTPYGFGTKNPDQTDCSGFTQQVFKNFGISLPRSAAEQAQYGQHVAFSDLQVGDLMFYRTYKDEPSHVAIYAGEGQIIHASFKNKRVQYDAIDKGYYKQRFLYAKRLSLKEQDTSNE